MAVFPFYIESNPGNRFCLYHPPSGACRGCVLFVPPFAEELNKSRRMIALQSRALSEIGYAVLSVDPYGCGDSSGDFEEARWEIWMEDLTLAAQWLMKKHEKPITLWGLRFGALMGLEFARTCGESFERIVLWQPVQSGEAHLTQFLRLRVTAEMLSGGKTTTQELRDRLSSDGTVEIAGYELPMDVAKNMDRLKLQDLGIPGVWHHWMEFTASGELSPASVRILDTWAKKGIKCDVAKVQGEPFWSTQEITDCPALIEETARLFPN